MPLSNRHSSSYRDPSGFLFYHNQTLYRQVNKSFKKDFDHFIDSGLYQNLVEKNMLISHEVINETFSNDPDWYRTLKPRIIPFISYPYEWCFDMLKDAALLTLEAAKEAMKFGMMLKDASAYNVQWHNGKMIFIDTLSFEKYDEARPWIAYRQFCENFFATLALMHYLREPLQNLSLAYPEGIPLSLTKKMLPFKSKFNLHTYLHIHLHGSTAKNSKHNSKARPFSKQKMANLLRSLEEGIRSFSFSQQGVWSNYYEEAGQRENYIKIKKEIVVEWLKKLHPVTVFDAGANEGEFSELAANHSSYVISADLDHYSINNSYKKIKQTNSMNIHPLVIDLSNPSPAIGLNNEERHSFLERTKADLSLALALIHHLAIGKNIPFEKIAAMFSNIGTFLIIEFVPKTDEKVKWMLQQKRDIYTHYTEEDFKTAFALFFSILETKEIANTGRTLYLMKKNA